MSVAADIAIARVAQAAPGDPAGEVRQRLTESGCDYADAVAVVEGGRLVGDLSITELLDARSSTPVGELMDAEPFSVDGSLELEHAAHRASRAGAKCVWVLGADGRIIGAIPIARLAQILVHEHDEDIARLGGYRSQRATAREAAEESISRRLLHRLPWILVGLAGAMVATLVVGSFEKELERVVALSFFLPAVVYLADAVGTQTETVLIRAMSAGVRIRDVLARELLTGLALGAIVAALFLPFAALGWDADVAVAVALALFGACSIATAVAMLLPALLRRLGRDPAFGAGPLATVVQDLLSIVLYFAIAVPIAT